MEAGEVAFVVYFALPLVERALRHALASARDGRSRRCVPAP
jgi:hypothetical protein